jgi:diguanylate cyclase (GGDEF)-like protein/PAS domain S-box-containing protein
MHIYANPAYLEMFGFEDLEDIEGTPIMDMVAPDNHTKVKDFLRRYSKGEISTSELEVVSLRPDGQEFNAQFEFCPASIEGEPCTQIVIRDQSVSEELEDKLKYLRKQDLLTGLYNRQYFLEEIDKMLHEAARSEKIYGVFFIAPDGFRRIKESIGIAGSDLVLTDMASLIRDTLGGTDVAARFGDNTFTVLTSISDPNTLKALAENIRSSLEKHICEINQQTITVTCSIGITIFTQDSKSAQEIISQADLACEMAVKEGGNRVHLHNPIADEMASRERDKQTIHMIQDAIENNRFHLVYQPIASLHGDTSEKYEVLLRMQDDEGTEILPTKFIPIAEKYKLMKDIDRWVIRNAINVIADRRAAGFDTTFFIKLSALSVNDYSLAPWVGEQLKKYRVPGNSVCFEVFESIAEPNLKSMKSLCEDLHILHCKISLEHFGKGANSIQLLQHLSVDYLKIDGSFMHDLARNRENQAIIKSISKMAADSSIITIAEFVEDASSLAVLWQCGITLIQGNFLQKPDDNMRYDFHGEDEDEGVM